MAEQENARYWDWVYDANAGDWRQPYPHIYTSAELPGEYVVRASDGKLYVLSDEPGAWCYRRELPDDFSGLKRVEPEEARRLVHTLAGGYTWLWPVTQPYILTD